MSVGRKNNVIIVPLITVGDKVIVKARDLEGNIMDIDWKWSNFLFVQKHTYLDVEGGKVGALAMQFPREEGSKPTSIKQTQC